MKMHHTLFLLVTLLFTSPLLAQTQPVKILAIGNSFADDGIEYLDEIAIAEGKRIIVANTFIGGCSLERHLDNARHDRHAYLYRKNTEGKYTEENDKSLLEAIEDEAWDYIVFQQVSSAAGQYSTYFPELSELMEYVRANVTNPHVQYAMQQTWAYAEDSTHPGFFRYGKDQQAMYEDIVFSYDQAAKKQNISIIIPTGTAIQNARSSSQNPRKSGSVAAERATCAMRMTPRMISMIPPASIHPRPVMKCRLIDERTTSSTPDSSISHPKSIESPR